MEYKLHRVARNSEGWERPSPGRLGANDVGSYIKEHGFGHEDWNFNYSFASSGEMLGYTVARPSAKLADQEFGVILATYDPSGWKAVGYYNGARFKRQAVAVRPSDAALQQMAVDVFELTELNSVSPEYRTKTLSEIEQTLREELLHHCWVIPRDRVVVFEKPVKISQRTFNPGRQRMFTSFNISENQFDHIINLGDSAPDRTDDKFEQAEGRRTLKLHESIERKPSLVSAFKQGLISFACMVCNFDFEKEYGLIGKAFIECHHTRPVAEMRPGERTKLSDLVTVCSNCHRMLHKASPMLTVEQLRERRERTW